MTDSHPSSRPHPTSRSPPASRHGTHPLPSPTLTPTRPPLDEPDRPFPDRQSRRHSRTSSARSSFTAYGRRRSSASATLADVAARLGGLAPLSGLTTADSEAVVSDEEDEEDGWPNELFLGLDCSTQALKASAIDDALQSVAEIEVRFDRDLPEFKTEDGVHMGPPGSGLVMGPVMMYLKAIDLLFDRMLRAGWAMSDFRAVSGAGQQHASVYWSSKAPSLLSNLSPRKPLHAQLSEAFSRADVPNWQDASTVAQCAAMEEHVGGPEALAQITGSRAHTRFTGPQVMRIREQEPEAYKATHRVSLVSSFLTTIFAGGVDGEIAPLDESDAAGMNLWDMRGKRGWNKDLLDIVSGGNAKELEKKLGEPERDGGKVVGRLRRWFVERYGMREDCIVCTFTGDNPATFLSQSLATREGIVSLGTSDTVLLSLTSYSPHPEYHIFPHPARKPGDEPTYMAMLCYKNGSLAREWVRNRYFESDWTKFDAGVRTALDASILKKTGTGFYFLKPEIIPSGAVGVHRFSRAGEPVEEFSQDAAKENALAILRSQFSSFRVRSSKLLQSSYDKPNLKAVVAVGGSAKNKTILGVLSDMLGSPVFDVDVAAMSASIDGAGVQSDGSGNSPAAKPRLPARPSTVNSCSFGAAMKAAWCYVRHVEKRKVLYDDFVKEMAERTRKLAAKPNMDRFGEFGSRLEEWEALEGVMLDGSRGT